MRWPERIVLDPGILVGKPVVRGTRLAVEFVIDLLAEGWTEAEILEEYPLLKPEDIRACLAYASAVLHAEKIYAAGTWVLRFLADENFPKGGVEALRERGHDVLWMQTEAPGSNDTEVLRRATSGERVLLTFDKDFGELAFKAALTAGSGIVLFRISRASRRRMIERITALVESRSGWAGHFSVIEDARIRVVPLPPVRPQPPG